MKRLTAFLRDDPRLLLYGVFLTFGSSFGQTFFISLFAGQIQADFGLSHGGFGSVYSIATLASACLLVWTGQWLDRIELRTWTAILIPAFAGACLVMAFAEGWFALVVAIFLLRQCGQGLMSSTSITVQARYYRSAPGRAVATASVGYMAGEGLFPVITVLLMAAIGWRQVWLLAAAALVLIWLPTALWLIRDQAARHARYLRTFTTRGKDQPAGSAGDEPAATVQRQWQRREVLRDPRFYLVLPAMLAPSFIGTGFFFHQVHLAASKGWPLTLWASAFLAYAAASFPSSLIFGAWVDRVGAVKALPWFLPPLALACTVLAAMSHPAAAWIFMIAIGVSSGFIYTLSGVFWAEVYGTQHLGSIRALTMALSVFASAGSPALMGLLIDAGVSMEALALTAALYCAGGIGLTVVAAAAYKKAA